MKKRILLLTLTLVFFSYPVSATVINYNAVNLSGDTWRYNYSITNDTLSQDIKEFTIWFDLGLYDNLSILNSPLDWDSIAIQPDARIPAEGFFDSLALSSGVAVGESLSGFSVVFDWLGQNTPGSQFFEIIDPFSFNTIDSGFTTEIVDTPSVPEPSVLLLLIPGLLLIRLLSDKNQMILENSRGGE